MLHERQAQAGAALGAAFSDIDAIKPLGQPRQMFRRNAGPVVPDRHDGVASCGGRGFARERDVDTLARCAIFQGILDQVFEHPNEFVAVARNDERACLVGDLDFDVPLTCKRRQAVGNLVDDHHEIGRVVGMNVGLLLDSRQRQQVVDEARHAGRLFLHDGKKAIARRRIVARRALQRFDEA